MKIEAQKIYWGVTGRHIIKSICLDAGHGEIIGLVGPNGSGKSSLLRVLYRFYFPHSGRVLLGGQNIFAMNAREVFRKQAVVTQERSTDFEFSVYEVVLMGRTPYKTLLENDTQEDVKIVRKALNRVGMLSFLDREFSTLSGGEKQRVLIARALAQKTEVLLLDEPTNHLDPRYQIEIMDLIRSLGFTAIVAMHDLNMAAAYCNRIYLLKSGRVVIHGLPSKVLTNKIIRNVYGVNAEVGLHPKTGKLNIVFTRLDKQD